jgi:hypothetical protein
MNKQLDSQRNFDRQLPSTASNDLSGQLVSRDVLPDLKSIYQSQSLIFATLNLEDLTVGKNFLDVKHYYPADARDKPYYTTSLTNRSGEKIRIDRFACYTQHDDFLALHTMTGGFFSAQQFIEWYNLDGENAGLGEGDGWIAPGAVVSDPNNHSNLGVYWAYFGTTASGQTFVTGAPWLGAKPWWQLW